MNDATPISRPLPTHLVIGVHCLAWLGLFSGAYVVVARLKRLFEGFEVELPAAAIIVINLADLVANYGYLIVPAVLGIVIAFDVFVCSVPENDSGSGTARMWFWTMLATPLLLAVLAGLALLFPLWSLLNDLR